MVKNGIYIYNNRIIKIYSNNKLHSDKYPAIYYYDSEKANFQYWYNDGKLHRLNGPATYHKTGVYTKEYWYFEGKIHRDNGPSIIWKQNNKVTFVDWFLNGVRVPNCNSDEDFRKYKLKAFL